MSAVVANRLLCKFNISGQCWNTITFPFINHIYQKHYYIWIYINILMHIHIKINTYVFCPLYIFVIYIPLYCSVKQTTTHSNFKTCTLFTLLFLNQPRSGKCIWARPLLPQFNYCQMYSSVQNGIVNVLDTLSVYIKQYKQVINGSNLEMYFDCSQVDFDSQSFTLTVE